MSGATNGPGADTTVHRILIVEDHPIVRDGINELACRESDLSVCAQTADPQEALQLIEDLRPDMAIVDISLGNTSGLELTKRIRARGHMLPILILSMHDEAIYAERALRAGASGYIMKKEASELLRAAIRQVLSGGIYLSQAMTARLVRSLVRGQKGPPAYPIDGLTDRELEIFCLIGKGLGTRQIAEALHVSIKTVESHRAHIKDKLMLQDANELLLSAIRWAQEQSIG